MSERELTVRDRLRGLILGLAVGDAIGLPMEGLGPSRIPRLFPGPLRHRFVFGRGMISDDTEHAFFVAQAWLAHPADVEAFSRSLAWKLRGWLLGLPAGAGMATLRAVLKLWAGVCPSRSGVYSAGNGPAMRSPILGAVLGGDAERLRAYTEASTRITHTDPKALVGAAALAEAAAWAVGREPEASFDPEAVFPRLAAVAGDPEWQSLIETMRRAHEAGDSVADYAASLGLSRGVTGYMYHSAPVALYAWMRHWGDYRATIEAVVSLGGDTDSVAAFAGALAGACVGEAGIPEAWLTGIADAPRGVPLLRALADRLAEAVATGASPGPLSYGWLALPLRNALFLGTVLVHGFRRLAPPY